MSAVTSDIDVMETDYDANNYYGTAVEAAALATLALPKPASIGASASCADFDLTTTEVADFIAGFIKGFTNNDHKTDLEGCFADTDAFEADICTFVADFRTKDNQKVLEGVHLLLGTDLPQLNGFISKCPAAVTSDWAIVGNWFKYWKAQGEMKVYSTAYKNIVGNMAEIKTDVKTLEGFFDKKDWFDSAVEASTIAKLALPLPAAENLGDYECKDAGVVFTDKDMSDYFAGFVAGLTGNDHKAYYESCLKVSTQFETDLCEIEADFKTKDNQKVLQAVQKILADVPEIKGWLDLCPNTSADPTAQDDIVKLENWFKFWKGQGEMKVYQTAYKNVIGNMAEIKTDIAALETAYHVPDYYETGKAAFMIAKIALPPQASEELFLQ